MTVSSLVTTLGTIRVGGREDGDTGARGGPDEPSLVGAKFEEPGKFEMQIVGDGVMRQRRISTYLQASHWTQTRRYYVGWHCHCHRTLDGQGESALPSTTPTYSSICLAPHGCGPDPF